MVLNSQKPDSEKRYTFQADGFCFKWKYESEVDRYCFFKFLKLEYNFSNINKKVQKHIINNKMDGVELQECPTRDGTLKLEEVWKSKSTTQTNKKEKSKLFTLAKKGKLNVKLI